MFTHSLKLDSTTNQMNSLHIFTPNLFKICFNISLSIGTFLSGFQTNTVCTFVISPIHVTCHTHIILLSITVILEFSSLAYHQMKFNNFKEPSVFFIISYKKGETGKTGWQQGGATECCQQCYILENSCGLCFIYLLTFLSFLIFDFLLMLHTSNQWLAYQYWYMYHTVWENML